MGMEKLRTLEKVFDNEHLEVSADLKITLERRIFKRSFQTVQPKVV